ncbi:MAG: hypothetical protein KKB51_05260 [Candidatus Riflebacteria bacterium]|nr:hypothetical protein [Candidatus Riflebacteria bacterium]
MIIVVFIALLILVDSLIFWAFTEAVRDKDFSEGMGIGECFVHCAIANIIGVGVKMTQTSAPIHLFYLFRPFGKIGLNFTSKVLCLVIMGAAEFGILLVFAKPIAAAMR